MRPVPRLTPESFYEKYWDRLVAELEDEFGRADAEDIVQNAFIRSLGKKSVSPAHGEGTQLYRFRREYLLQEAKCRRKDREQEQGWETSIEPGMPASQDTNPLFCALMHETQEEIWRTFQEYWQEHPKHAEVVYMASVGGMSLQQIGKMKGYSRSWASPVFAKGVRMLWRPGDAYKRLRECHKFIKEAKRKDEWG